MKKANIVIICCLIILLLTGCVTDPQTYYFDSDELLGEVTKIELVECVNENPKMITVNDGSVPKFDVNSIKLIVELPNNKMDDFIADLSTITFHKENESVDSPTGYAVLIYNDKDEIIVISCTVLNNYGYSMVAKFSIDGKFVEHIAKFADEPKYRNLLEKYFNI